MSKRKKLALKITLGIVIILLAAVYVNFIPTFSLKTPDMKLLSGNWVNVYYETEEAAAKDVFGYADEQTGAINPLTFSNCGGYIFAHTYIEYLDLTYGWEKVLSLIETEDYNKCFGKSREEIYDECVNYISNYYQ